MSSHDASEAHLSQDDTILRGIVDFACNLSFQSIPHEVVTAARARMIDALGCAIGARLAQPPSETARIGAQVAALPGPGTLPGRIVGDPGEVAAESAAFVNGCLIRDLDFNDTYPGHHPSDCLGALFAVGPSVGATVADLVTAMTVSYEISIRFLKGARLNRLGWDNGYSTGVGAAAAVATLLGLDKEQVTHAIAITATANVPMRATRAGQLSLWKGAATAYSMRNVVFGAALANQGMTGPEAPFTGRHGLVDLITGPLTLDPFPSNGGGFLLPMAKLKYWPVVYNMQALVWAGVELRERLGSQGLEHAQVQTYWSAWRESGSEPAKWDPQTRETADHSTPYILARVLTDGLISHVSFSPAAIQDQAVRDLMRRIEVTVNDEIEASYPERIRLRLLAQDTSGAKHDIWIENPPGHETNPMSERDVETKFARLCAGALDEPTVSRVLSALWHDSHTPVAELLDECRLPSLDRGPSTRDEQ